MSDLDMKYIEDEKGRKLSFVFRPSKDVSPSDAPLMIILHGHTFNAKPSKFYNPKWNVLVPIDNYGVDGCGSWWLGEDGDFFVKELLSRLVWKIRFEYSISKGMFFWGSSMGGYGALLHGMLLDAKAVYANIPQIKLLGTSYSEAGSKKFFEPIFKNKSLNEFNDVTNFLNFEDPKNNPLFFIAQSRFDYPNYVDEHALYFLDKCLSNDINIHFEIAPIKGHNVIYPINECLEKVEEFVDFNDVDLEIKKKIEIYQYVKNKVYTEINVNNGKALIERDEFRVSGFSPFIFSKIISWSENPFNNRTWMWHLHQMTFINYLLAYDIEYYSFQGTARLLKLVKSWFDTFKNDADNEYAWHDHATAIRAINLVKLKHWLILWEKNEEVQLINEILIAHSQKLKDETFYSKYTNHGLDQSLALYMLSFETANSEIYTLAKNRLLNEVNYAFAEDGMHVENSPAYLNYGIKQILEILDFMDFYNDKNSDLLTIRDKIDKAIYILTHITKPDGKLPLIGDTKEFVVKDFFKSQKPKYYNEFLYSIRQGRQGIMPKEKALILKKSGWSVIRNSWGKDTFKDSIHIVFKCGFLSNYHRHDDDLHFTLYAYGEDWLIDGGEYKHDPQDPYRIYFRSSESHNISMPYKIKAHRDLNKSKQTGIKSHSLDDKSVVLSATSVMFEGFINSRRFEFDFENSLIKIHDTCIPDSNLAEERIDNRYNNSYTTYVTRFMIPHDKKVTVDKRLNEIKVFGKEKILKISMPNVNKNISIVLGRSEPDIRGWTSKKSSLLEKAYSVEVYHKEKKLDFSYEISWEDIKNDYIDIQISRKENKIYASLQLRNVKSLSGKLLFAFYLMYKNEKKLQRWYSNDNTVTFELDSKTDYTDYSIIGFVKDENNNMLRHSIRLS